jgi:hypothetical protein
LIAADFLSLIGLGIKLPAGYAVTYPAICWTMKREQKRGGIQMHSPIASHANESNVGGVE